MNNDAVDNFVQFYENFNINSIDNFQNIYAENISFQDPFHTILGNKNLLTYFQNMMERVTECSFDICDVVKSTDENKNAFVIWKMNFRHKMLNGGKLITTEGITYLKYDEKVYYHRDYFDSSQLLYRNIPVVRSLIKLIEGRM